MDGTHIASHCRVAYPVIPAQLMSALWNHGPPSTHKVLKVIERLSMDQDSWIVIATDEDNRRLAIDAEKLRLCYPEKYDIRITPTDLGVRFALAVRHRD
jgi:hypothetical protein